MKFHEILSQSLQKFFAKITKFGNEFLNVFEFLLKLSDHKVSSKLSKKIAIEISGG